METGLSGTEDCPRLDHHRHIESPVLSSRPSATSTCLRPPFKEASHPLAQGESPQQCLQTKTISFSTEQWPLTGVELERRKKELQGPGARRGVERRGAGRAFVSGHQPSPFPQRHAQGSRWTLLSHSLRTQACSRLAPPPQSHPGHLPPAGKLVISRRFKPAPTTSPAGQPCSKKPDCPAGTEQDLKGDLEASNRSPIPLPWEPHRPRPFFSFLRGAFETVSPCREQEMTHISAATSHF